VIKVVTENKPKRLSGLSQKAPEAGMSSPNCGIVDRRLPGREQAPNPTHSWKWNLITPVYPPMGQANRKGSCGVGGLEMSEEAKAVL
jgi:hypothetical protein